MFYLTIRRLVVGIGNGFGYVVPTSVGAKVVSGISGVLIVGTDGGWLRSRMRHLRTDRPLEPDRASGVASSTFRSLSALFFVHDHGSQPIC